MHGLAQPVLGSTGSVTGSTGSPRPGTPADMYRHPPQTYLYRGLEIALWSEAILLIMHHSKGTLDISILVRMK
jgi:hypothetical protein